MAEALNNELPWIYFLMNQSELFHSVAGPELESQHLHYVLDLKR
jgi:hypothetical protein